MLNSNTNLIISGLRGVGKTVLLDTLRPLAIRSGWIWAGADLSESVSVSEKKLSLRILADLASAVSGIQISETQTNSIGYQSSSERHPIYLSFDILHSVYDQTPGLESDKLKKVFQFTWERIYSNANGIVLAYLF